jgi:hypothetical protein
MNITKILTIVFYLVSVGLAYFLVKVLLMTSNWKR